MLRYKASVRRDGMVIIQRQFDTIHKAIEFIGNREGYVLDLETKIRPNSMSCKRVWE